MDSLAKLICIEISFFLLIYAWLLARTIGAWSHPAVIYAVFWFALTFLPLIGVWSAPIEPWALVYIFATVVAFSLPAFCCNWQPAIDAARARRNERPSNDRLFWLFCAMQVCTIIFVLIDLSIQGFTVGQFLSEPLSTANHFLKARYNGATVMNVFSQAGHIFNYTAVALAGILVPLQRTRLRILALIFLAFSPSILHMAIYADKGTLFLAVAYFYAGVLVARVRYGDTSLINWATLKAAFAALIVLVPLLIFTMLSRGADQWAGQRVPKLILYLRSYAFAQLYAFSDWFNQYYFGTEPPLRYNDPDGLTYGFWTFLAIGKQILPDYRVPPGYFAEYFSIPGVINTNIYTQFRPLIYDYGLIGSLVFLALCGTLASLAYNSMLRTRSPAISQSFFILVISCIYSSFTFSLMAWNSVYAAAIATAFILFANKTFLSSPPEGAITSQKELCTT